MPASLLTAEWLFNAGVQRLDLKAGQGPPYDSLQDQNDFRNLGVVT